MTADELAQQVAHRVRELIAEAEERAKRIVAEAEEAAETIRTETEADMRTLRAETEADVRERLEAARRALEGETQPGAPEAPTGPPVPEPTPEPEPEEPAPKPDDTGHPSANGDDQAARLVAMKMALDGKSREEIERELSDKLGPGDRTALLDEVLARAGK
jgi:hypothetical protein